MIISLCTMSNLQITVMVRHLSLPSVSTSASLRSLANLLDPILDRIRKLIAADFAHPRLVVVMGAAIVFQDCSCSKHCCYWTMGLLDPIQGRI